MTTRVALVRTLGCAGLLVLPTLTPFTAQAQPPASRARQHAAATRATVPGLSTLSETQLRAYLTFVADDLLEGRNTPSRGLDITARYLASLLTRWGLEPAGDDGSFFQTIALTRHRLEGSDTRLEVGERQLRLGEHFLPLPTTAGTAEGPLVYVGYGYVVPGRQIDPYAGIDVAGKIVVMHQGLPPGLSRSQLEGEQGRDWDDGPGAAAARGAVGILYLPTLSTLEAWGERLHRAEHTGALTVDAFQPATPRLPAAYLAPSAFEAVFAGERFSPEDMHRRVAAGDAAPPFALSPSKHATLTVALSAEPVTTQNVVAVWRGSDTVLRNEYVALGAHYDHVGMRPGPDADGSDRIYNGADDDGSGTVALLGMAEALAHAPSRPKRSVLFVWHAGEEHGLWGSRYFTDHPTVPLDSIVAQLNVDMIGRSRAPGDTVRANARLTGPDSVYVIGSRLMSTEMGRLVDEVNDGLLGLTYDYSYADPNDPSRFFYRSDHYHYAKRGIPVAFFFSGVHEDYHGVGDEVDGIDFRKLHRVTQTIYATAWALATRATRPVVDTPFQER